VQRAKTESRVAPTQSSELLCTATRAESGTVLKVIYGDITSRGLMSSEPGRRGIVSADDTCVSAGGGVAYALLSKAGVRTILNELSKLAPIDQGDVAVTSGGDLPVHYILHAAALKIERDATYSVTQADVSRTVERALKLSVGLSVQSVLVPLIAAGVGPLTALQSFEAIVRSLLQADLDLRSFTMSVVILKESELPRTTILDRLQALLPPDFTLQVTAQPA